MSQINLFVIMIANQLDGVLHYRHHSQAEQVHFNNVHVGTIVLVPLHDSAARHRSRLEWNDRIQLPLTYDHTAGMLSEMSRQILQTQTKFQEFTNTRLAHIEARHTELSFECVGFILVFKMPDQLCQALECFDIEAENFADFTSGRASTICNDIGRHRRAKVAIPLVDILDGALALIAAGEIEIDVRPLTSLFGKESFEEQSHLYRINGCDTQ